MFVFWRKVVQSVFSTNKPDRGDIGIEGDKRYSSEKCVSLYRFPRKKEEDNPQIPHADPAKKS